MNTIISKQGVLFSQHSAKEFNNKLLSRFFFVIWMRANDDEEVIVYKGCLSLYFEKLYFDKTLVKEFINKLLSRHFCAIRSKVCDNEKVRSVPKGASYLHTLDSRHFFI